MNYSIRKFTTFLILVVLTISSGFTRQVNAQNPILEYVGDWAGELTIKTKLVNGGKTHQEWNYYIEPSFKIGEVGSLTGTAKVKFIPIDFSIRGTKCKVIYPQRDEFPMTGGLLWLPGYEIYGITDTLLGNISFYLPELPAGGSASFKGTGECIKCTVKFSYYELPQEMLEFLPIMCRGEIEGESGPDYFSFGNKTLIDLEKVEESLGIYCVSIKGSGKLVRPAKTLALNFKGKWRSGGPEYFSEAMGTVWKEGKGEPLQIITKFKKWDKIVTRPKSKVKIKLDGASNHCINENTEIRFKSENELELIFGEIYSKIKSGGNYKVQMPQAVAGVRGTQFITKVKKDGTTILTVLDGEVEFSDTQKKKTVLVKKNQRSTINPKGLPSDPISIDHNQIPTWWK